MELLSSDGTKFIANVDPNIDQRTIDILAKVFQAAYERVKNEQLHTIKSIHN